MPTQKYTLAPEIFGHARRIAEHFGLYDKALFSTAVTGLAGTRRSARWIIRTDRGDRIRARFVAMGTGPLHRPKLPGIPGIETFAGALLPHQPLGLRLHRRDPGGAPWTSWATSASASSAPAPPPCSASRIWPRAARELYVFQRTPSSIDVRNNHPIDPALFAALEPGWQRAVARSISPPSRPAASPRRTWSWTAGPTSPSGSATASWPTSGEAGATFGPEDFRRAYEESDDEKMTRSGPGSTPWCADRRTAEALKPWYRQLCKRPCFHDEYLQAFNEPGVTPRRHRRPGRRGHRRDRGLGRRAGTTSSTA